MKKNLYRMWLLCLFVMTAQMMTAQQRRPIDPQHPMWMIHVDVWNSADPQKIIDLIPEDIRPYVCMNLSLSCQYDTDYNMYRMPRCAVRTYRSWASVCQLNGMWFTCQPASGGHTHIQDDDLETFEYFFKTYPNFLGWNYAEQFWGFDAANDKSSSTQASRIALFAKLVPMHHKYGGVLTVSFCGNVWSHPLNPLGMMKRNKELLQACKDYPEAILWLFKYTTSSCWYNNESVTFGPYVSGLAKNYGVRYDNCGYNGALDAVLGEKHGKKYPGAAGIGTVMEQTTVNGGAVWDGPELIWTEDFQNQGNTNVDGYTRRNWGTFGNFDGVWTDMFRKVIDGTLYIPTREEVVSGIKIAIKNDVISGSDEDKYATWGDLYDNIYKQTDPFNRGNGQWMDNFWYLKSTGRYGTIPMVIGFYDDVANAIPVKVNKSARSSRWGTQAKKVADFNEQYPEVSKGDLFVNRYRNRLVTYTPYSYLNSKTTASADIPLKYNTCDSLKLTWNKLTGAYIREYADSITFYLNNYRSDTTSTRLEKIVITGCKSQPSYSITKHEKATTGRITPKWDAATGTYTLSFYHFGGIDLVVRCSGNASDRLTDVLPAEALPTPKQPEAFKGKIEIEAEDMDYKSVQGVTLTNSGYFAPEVTDYAGNGFVDMGTNTAGALRHFLTLQEGGDYDIYVRYCQSSKAGSLTAKVNTPTAIPVAIEQVGLNDWHKAKFTATMKAGRNTLILTNTDGISMKIDQIIYVPAGTPDEKFLVSIREAEGGTVAADAESVAEGQTVRLAITPNSGWAIKELRVVNSVFFTQDKTIPVEDGATEVTFTMPDENVTILPVFYDKSQSYVLDFANTLSGTLPEGWRTTDGSDVRDYPTSASSGPRTFDGFTGYQGKALYWRNTSAEYGRLAAWPLTLEPGNYKLTFAMAAWKESPKYKVQLLNAATGSSIATSPIYTAAPNAGGSTSANVSAATSRELKFTVSTAGNYVIKFSDETSTGGYHEFLLLECTVKADNTASAIGMPTTGNSSDTGIWSLTGTRQGKLNRGLNIVRSADGKIRKIMVR
ncbi:MAG: glycosyl hydrolase family 98 [Prevotella sp.]|nr:glycosyl hydrolase family 98 [Prevotella sp.]